MKSFFVTFLLSFVASLILVRVARDLGNRYGITDQAFGRKVHTGAIPRLGGAAVAIAFYLPVYGILFWNNDLTRVWRSHAYYGWALAIFGVATVLLGLYDDIWHMRARHKLVVQLAIAVGTFFAGVQIQAVSLPFIGQLDMGVFALPVTVFWILGFMNAVNLIDGIDGLCGGVVFIAAVATFVLARTSDAILVAFFAAALAGSVLGFLRYNFNPASIFLGDSGSYFLGYVLATMAIVGSRKAAVSVAVLAPLMAAGLPILDTLLAITRRAMHGRPIFAPDRGHIHHRLLDRGYSTRRVVMLLYAVQTFLAGAGIIIAFGQNWSMGLGVLTVFVAVFYLVRVTGILSIPRNAAGEVAQSMLPESKSDQMIGHLPAFYRQLMTTPGGEPLRLLLAEFARKNELEEMEIALRDGESTPLANGSTTAARTTSGSNAPASAPAAPNNETVVMLWRQPEHIPVNKRCPLVKAAYTLKIGDRAVGTWRLSWRSEMGVVSADTHALLTLTGMIMAEKIVTLEPVAPLEPNPVAASEFALSPSPAQ